MPLSPPAPSSEVSLSWDRLLVAALVVLTLTPSALAHGSSGTGGFSSGLSHPVSGMDHITAMVAVGLWGAQLRNPALWLLPVFFPVVMAFGGFLGLAGIPVPGVEVGIALSSIVLGVMVLGAFKPPLGVALAIVSAFAVFHGHAHGTELAEDQDGLLYSAGFVVSTGLLHLGGIALGLLEQLPHGDRILRALGAGILGAGLFFLWSALA